MSGKPQRYKLTWEFELRSRGDYTLARAVIQQALNQLAEGFMGMKPYFLSLERVEWPPQGWPPKESP